MNDNINSLKHGKKIQQEIVKPYDEGYQPGSLQDGGHVLLSCSNCRAILIDIWRTRPNEPYTWKVQATCPFCGDKSFVEEVKGGFHIGGYGKVKEDDEEDDFPSTVVEGFTCENDTFIYNVTKAHPDAKPIKR